MNNTVSNAISYNKIYNLVMAIMHILAIICIFPIFAMDPELGTSGAFIITSITALFIIPLIILFFFLAANLQKKKKWIYFLNFVSLALGFGSILTIIPCAFLAIKWASQEVKDYYNI